jgi:hypothetical protein
MLESNIDLWGKITMKEPDDILRYFRTSRSYKNCQKEYKLTKREHQVAAAAPLGVDAPRCIPAS